MSRLVLVRRRHRCLWTCPDRRRQVGEPSIRIPPPKPGPKPAIERRCLIRWQCAVRTAVPVSSRRQSEKKEKEFFFVCFTRARKKKAKEIGKITHIYCTIGPSSFLVWRDRENLFCLLAAHFGYHQAICTSNLFFKTNGL